MLCITRVVGGQCAVYDSDDGSIEWHTLDTIKQFEGMGYTFRRGTVELEPEMCNFGKDKQNIFTDFKLLHHGGDRYELISKSAGKKLKLRMQNGKLCFNIGVNVSAQKVNINVIE